MVTIPLLIIGGVTTIAGVFGIMYSTDAIDSFGESKNPIVQSFIASAIVSMTLLVAGGIILAYGFKVSRPLRH